MINSVKQDQEGSLIAPGFNNSFVSMEGSTESGNGHICSGPPTSFTVELKEISLRTGQGDALVWSGSSY